MAKTKIEWADRVWNPVVGCTPASEGCAHCYAKRIYDRFYQDKPFSKIQLHPERVLTPFQWRKPSRIFVNSMSDLFHPDVPFKFIDDIFGVMTGATRHTFMVLTKRPDRMLEFANQYYLPGAKVTNIWMGVTVENQRTADERIPLLLQTPAAVRFISVEPMLGPVDLTGINGALSSWWKNGEIDCVDKGSIGWVICGGETGPGARPMHPDWVRALRDQCQDAGVPFFFKSWGEWVAGYPQGISMANRAQKYIHGSEFFRVGKKLAGRLLDGREWNEFPEHAE